MALQNQLKELLLLSALHGPDSNQAWHDVRAAFQKIKRKDDFYPITRLITPGGVANGLDEGKYRVTISLKKLVMKKLVFVLSLMTFAYLLSAQSHLDSLHHLMQQLAQQQEAINALEEEKPFLHWQDYIGIGFIISAVVGLIGYYFKTSIEAAKNTAISNLQVRIDEFERSAKGNIQLTEEKIITAINGNEALLNKIRDAADLEELLIKTKKINLIGETPDTILSILTNVGFLRKNLFTEADDENSDYDVLFINNENGKVNLEEAVQVVKGLPDNVHVFHYTSKHNIIFPTGQLPYEARHRVNFATNPAQIYGNLINTLKYQHRLSKV